MKIGLRPAVVGALLVGISGQDRAQHSAPPPARADKTALNYDLKARAIIDLR